MTSSQTGHCARPNTASQLFDARLQGKSSTEQGDFSFCTGLLTPLYMARATEEVVWGPESATLATSADVALAGDLAHWLVLHSRTNPAMYGTRVHVDQTDPMGTYQAPAQVRASPSPSVTACA